MARHFSMIRDFHLADVLTLVNGAAGTAAIFCAMEHVRAGRAHTIYAGGACVVLALVFDVADGRVARWRHRASAMGRELDSLADVVSFGVAPAALGYAIGLRGLLDETCLLYFVCCGISRLARYNITAEALSRSGSSTAVPARPTEPSLRDRARSAQSHRADGGTAGKVTYFEGTPIPSSILLVALAAALTRAGWIGPELPGGTLTLAGADLHPLALLYVLSGSLMISKTIHIPKL